MLCVENGPRGNLSSTSIWASYLGN